MDVQAKTIRFQPVKTAHLILSLRFLAVFALMAFYCVPKTAWSFASPYSWLVVTRTGSTDENVIRILSLACFAFSAFALRKGLEAPQTRLLAICGIAYTAVLTYSASIASSSLATANDCLSVLVALSTGLFGGWLLQNRRLQTLMILALAAVQGVEALIFRVNGMGLMYSGTVLRMGGTFDAPGLLATIMIVALPTAFALSVRAKQTVSLGLLVMVAAICFACLVLTWSRNAFAAVAVGCGYVVWKLVEQKGTRYALTAVLALLVCGTFAMRSSNPTNAASAARSVDGRARLVSESIERASKAPLSGAGVGNVVIRLKWTGADAVGRPPKEDLLDPRSVALLWLLELGLAGAAMYVALAVGTARFAANVGPSDIEGVALAGGLVTLVLAGLVDTTFGQVNHGVGTALLGLLLGSAVGVTAPLNPQKGSA